MFLEDLASLLVTGGAGTSGGLDGTIFRSAKANIPPRMDVALISLTDTGGTDPLGVHNSDGYRRPSASVLVRGGSLAIVQAGYTLAYNALVTVKGRRVNFFVGPVWYVSLVAKQEPFELPLDELGRVRYAFNVDAVKRPT